MKRLALILVLCCFLAPPSYGDVKTITYANGDKYIGELKNGKRHGHGTFTFSNVMKYVGDWKDDKMEGEGTVTFGTGVPGAGYSGQFKNSKPHGHGALLLPDGARYIGQFRDGIKHGQGRWTDSGGSKYDGEWRDDLKHGQGTVIWANGSQYVGEWKNNKVNGQGTWTHEKGSSYGSYAGEWKDNKFHGYGTLVGFGLKIEGVFYENKTRDELIVTALESKSEGLCIAKGEKFAVEFTKDKRWNVIRHSPSGEIIETIESKEELSDRSILDVMKNLLHGLGTPQPSDGTKAYERGNYSAAYKDALTLAEQGDTQSMWNLSVLFMKGQGVPEDHVEAAKWLRKFACAEPDHALAQYMIALMYHEGDGVLPSKKWAEYFFQRALLQGHGDSAFYLADLSPRDINGRPSMYAYLIVGRALGSEKAKKILKEIDDLQQPFFTESVRLSGDAMARQIWAKIEAAKGN